MTTTTEIKSEAPAFEEAPATSNGFVVEAPPEPQPRNSGPRSYAWWEAIAQCESGNTNGWRTGYYGIEADHPIGHLSKAEQLAWAEQIYRDYGDRAWGCSGFAWAAVPAG